MKLKKLGVQLGVAVSVMMVGGTAEAKDVGDYSDVHDTDWFYPYVAEVSEKELMTGMDDVTFNPNGNLERGQFATILYRMDGAEASYEYRFPDVTGDKFYSAPVTWANDAGVIKGYENGSFGPSDKITREQLATMLYRYAGAAEYDMSASDNLDSFPDAGSVSDFAVDAMKWSVGTGIIGGDNGNLNPQGDVSRAVCATMIARLSKQTGHEHNWIAQYKTVEDYQTVTDYENQPIYEEQPIYETRPVYTKEYHIICGCGVDCGTDRTAHTLGYDGSNGGYGCNMGYSVQAVSVQTGTESVQVGTQQVQVGTQQVAVGSHQELVGTHQELTGYACSCGAKK